MIFLQLRDCGLERLRSNLISAKFHVGKGTTQSSDTVRSRNYRLVFPHRSYPRALADCGQPFSRRSTLPPCGGLFFGGKQRPQSVYVLDEMELHTRRVSIFSSPRYTRASGFNAPFTAQKLRGTPAPTYRLIVEDRCNLCDAPIPRQPPSPKGHPAPARRAENYRPLSKKSSSRSPPARTPCPRRA